MQVAHWTQSIVCSVTLLVMRHLQCVRENCHLERISDLHDLSGEVFSRTMSCRISSLLCILQSISQYMQTSSLAYNVSQKELMPAHYIRI